MKSAPDLIHERSQPLTPELREWARRQFTEEEIAAGLRELKEKGGQELGEILPELQQIITQP